MADFTVVLALPKRHRSIAFQSYLQASRFGSLLELVLERLSASGRRGQYFLEVPRTDCCNLVQDAAKRHDVEIIPTSWHKSLQSLLTALKRTGHGEVVLVDPECMLAPFDVLDRTLDYHRSHQSQCTWATELPPRLSLDIYNAEFVLQLSRMPLRGLRPDPRLLAKIAASASQLAPHCKDLPSHPVLFDVRSSYRMPPQAWPSYVGFETPSDTALACKLIARAREDRGLDLLQEWRCAVDLRRERARSAWPTRPARHDARPHRILLVSNASIYSGAHAALLSILQHIDYDRFLPHVLLSRAGAVSSRIEALGVRLYCPDREFNAPTFENLSYLRHVFEVCNPDLVHCDGMEGVNVCCMAKLSGMPLIHSARVMDLRDIAPELTYADHVVAVSKRVRDQVCALGIAPQRVSVVYDGVELDEPGGEMHPRHVRVQARGAFGIESDLCVIGIMARIERQKRQHLVAAATAAARQSGCGVVTVVAGEPLDEVYLDELRQFERSGAVKLLGFQEDSRFLMSACDVVAAVGEGEGAGMSILEAMANALPVIVSHDGGGAELVDDGVTGFVVNAEQPGDLCEAVITLASDHHRRTAMGAAARRRSGEEFSAARMTSQLMDLYGANLDDSLRNDNQ
jgi:glycosyltransferase involved in cell wall biosynthesis